MQTFVFPRWQALCRASKVKARENFKLNLLIKVTNFEQISDYRLGPHGRPRLASQTADSKGSMLGFVGGETNEVVNAYR